MSRRIVAVSMFHPSTVAISDFRAITKQSGQIGWSDSQLFSASRDVFIRVQSDRVTWHSSCLLLFCSEGKIDAAFHFASLRVSFDSCDGAESWMINWGISRVIVQISVEWLLRWPFCRTFVARGDGLMDWLVRVLPPQSPLYELAPLLCHPQPHLRLSWRHSPIKI